MAEQPIYCPFLDRADHRCAEHFTIDHLDHAFAYCFDRYTACPYYVQLLAEREVRMLTTGAAGGDEGFDAQPQSFRFRPAASLLHSRRSGRTARIPVVQVTVRRSAIGEYVQQSSYSR